jgi:hypothetical protein
MMQRAVIIGQPKPTLFLMSEKCRLSDQVLTITYEPTATFPKNERQSSKPFYLFKIKQETLPGTPKKASRGSLFPFYVKQGKGILTSTWHFLHSIPA